MGGSWTDARMVLRYFIMFISIIIEFYIILLCENSLIDVRYLYYYYKNVDDCVVNSHTDLKIYIFYQFMLNLLSFFYLLL